MKSWGSERLSNVLKEQSLSDSKVSASHRIEWFLAKHREAPSGTRWQCFHRWGEQRAYVYVEMGRDGVIGGEWEDERLHLWNHRLNNDNAMQSPFVRIWAKACRS